MWPFKPRTPTQPAPIATVSPNTTLGVGTWVKTSSGSIGILTQIMSTTEVEVTYTKADGTNVMVLTANDLAVPFKEVILLSQVRRASISDIPTARYESVEQLKALGYGDK